MNPKLLVTFDKFAAATFDKQMCLQDTLGELDDHWSFDLESGILGFGGVHEWQTQVLGTQSEASGTWLWGWANDKSGIPQAFLHDVNALRRMGEQKGIAELCTPKLPTDTHDGHFWSVLATGLCRAPAYYCGPYEGGALFMLIKDPRYRPKIDRSLVRFATMFPQALATYEITDHKLALQGHAAYLGLTVTEQGNDLIVSNDRGHKLLARFDPERRLTKLEGKVG